jgi:hypothetical protein
MDFPDEIDGSVPMAALLEVTAANEMTPIPEEARLVKLLSVLVAVEVAALGEVLPEAAGFDVDVVVMDTVLSALR